MRRAIEAGSCRVAEGYPAETLDTDGSSGLDLVISYCILICLLFFVISDDNDRALFNVLAVKLDISGKIW